MLQGLSAFPLTPIRDERVDTAALGRIVDRLAAAGVDSIGALGSTGAAPLLSRDERALAARTVVEHAGGTPVVVGIGALRTREVLAHAEDAQAAGASALLLAPVAYQPLTSEEVLGLFRTVLAAVDVPVVIYDNPRTTRFSFTPELYGQIAALGGIAGVKVPGVPTIWPGSGRYCPPGRWSGSPVTASARRGWWPDATPGSARSPGSCRSWCARSWPHPTRSRPPSPLGRCGS